MTLDRGTEGLIIGSIRTLEMAVDKHSKMSEPNKEKVREMVRELNEILTTEGRK